MNLDYLETIDMAQQQNVEAEIGPSNGRFAVATVNFSLAAMHLSVNIFQLFILPVYFLPRSMWWSVALIPIAALNNPFWALVHEAIHDLLHPSHRINSAAGRLLSIFFGAPFQVLRLTHLSHHKYNRSPLEKGTEIYDPEKISRAKAACAYFFYILCGLFLLEVSSALIFFLPRAFFDKLRRRLADGGNTQEKWLARKFMDDQLVRQIRIDGILIFLIFGLSAFCYREHWQIFLGLIMARMFLISFMDNVYHYGTRLHATISGHNLWLPRFLSAFVLNFNFHRVHHRNPNVPWIKLPQVFGQQSEKFDRNFFAAAVDQLYGPIAVGDLAASAPATKRS